MALLMAGRCIVAEEAAVAEEAKEQAPATNSIYALISVNNLDGTETHQVLSLEDLAAFRKEIVAKNAALNDAYAKLRADWKAKHEVKIETTTPDGKAKDPKTLQEEVKAQAKARIFPLSKPRPFEVRNLGNFPTQAAAEERKKALEEALAALAAKEAQAKTPAPTARPADSKYAIARPAARQIGSAPPPRKETGTSDKQPKELLDQLQKEMDRILAQKPDDGGDKTLKTTPPSGAGKSGTSLKNTRKFGEGSNFGKGSGGKSIGK